MSRERSAPALRVVSPGSAGGDARQGRGGQPSKQQTPDNSLRVITRRYRDTTDERLAPSDLAPLGHLPQHSWERDRAQGLRLSLIARPWRSPPPELQSSKAPELRSREPSITCPLTRLSRGRCPAGQRGPALQTAESRQRIAGNRQGFSARPQMRGWPPPTSLRSATSPSTAGGGGRGSTLVAQI